jgi:acetylornithine deacetylase
MAMSDPLTTQTVADRAYEEVVPLLAKLVSFDTTIREHTDAPREDGHLQRFIADYLQDIGCEVELIEPGAHEISDHPMYRPNQTFEGRPIIWSRLPGAGEGRSLMFNGHFDTVPADPVAEWTTGPWTPDIREGRLYGRGACDMKGGIACALAVAKALVTEGARPSGDLFFNVVPFEEVNGMGTTATMLRGRRADAAVCCEPTELNTLIACRGVLLGRLDVEGRSAHAEIVQPHHSAGGGVNAIDKLIDILVRLRATNEEWRTRPDKQHWLLSTPYVLTTVIQGGTFASNWPSHASAILNCCYLPGEVDPTGYGARVREEIEECVRRAAQSDPWLAEHDPTVEWLCDFPAAELDARHRLVATLIEVAERQRLENHHLVGFDSWADQVQLMREGGIPAVCFGPGSIHQAHAVDEYVELEDLRTCTRVYADLALTWTDARAGVVDVLNGVGGGRYADS